MNPRFMYTQARSVVSKRFVSDAGALQLNCLSPASRKYSTAAKSSSAFVPLKTGDRHPVYSKHDNHNQNWLPLFFQNPTTSTSRYFSSDDSVKYPSSTFPHQRPRGENFKKKKRKGSKTKQIRLTKDDHMTPEDEENSQMEEETRNWVNRVVVGLNLCPFAARPIKDHQLYVNVIRGDDEEHILQQILAQSLVFTQEKLPGTALLVCPDLATNDFDKYLDFLSLVTDGLLEDYDLVGKIQVVGFHPLFEFATEEEDQDNNSSNSSKMEFWTNRSPYPMFHILQESDVSNAVKIMKGNTDRVWQRNVKLLQSLQEKCSDVRLVQEYLTKGKDSSEKGDMKKLVKEVLDDISQDFPLLSRPIVGQEQVDFDIGANVGENNTS